MSDKKAFTNFLAGLAGGDVAIRLTEDLEKMHTALVEQVNENHSAAKGSITIKLDFKADVQGVVNIDCDVKCKEPRTGTGTTVRWLSDSGFGSEDPRQTRLPLRSVTKIEDKERN